MGVLYTIGVALIVIGAALLGLARVNLSNVKDWLVWATTNAEKDLGSGTGQLKLRQVYDLFVNRFPWVARFMSFTRFGKMVDNALVRTREMIEKNKAVNQFVNGEDAQKNDDSK